MQPRQARPSGFKRQSMTIAGLMMTVAVVAFYAWLFRAFLRQRASPLLLLPILVAFYLVWAPLQIKWKHWLSADPHYEPIDAASDQVPLRVAESIAETAGQVEALGFRPLGLFRSDRTTANAASYLFLFEDTKARCVSQLFTVFAASGVLQRVVTVLNFRTEFTDGTSLITANSRAAKLFPPVRLREGSMSFPWIDAPRPLYEIHRASVAHYAADGIPRETDIGDPADFLQASSRREIAGIAEVGYLRLDEPRRVYRYTWKGAVLATWKLTWPIRPIRQMLRRRKAARILRELGLDRFAAETRGFEPASLS
jgi:hypothetical protein